MYWSTHSRPVPLEELGWINTTYLSSAVPRCDPMLFWGTTIEIEPLEAFLAEQRRSTGRIVSPAHYLVFAVARSLMEHPEVNRRVIGRRVYQYDGVNIVMPMLQTSTGEVDCVFLHHAEQMSVSDVAGHFWNEARGKAVAFAEEKRRRQSGWSWKSLGLAIAKRLDLLWIRWMSPVGFFAANHWRFPTVWAWQQELNGANAFVNYLGFPGAPPLIAHKAAALPMNAYSVLVTMGPAELKPVVVDGAIVIRKQATLFVRLDHRLVNGHQAAAFVSTLRTHLTNPQSATMEESSAERRAA